MPSSHRFAHARRDTAAAQARRRKYASREHRQAVAAGKRQMARDGHLPCWRCTGLIWNGAPWHVGHDDYNVDLIRGYEHAGCNIKAAARKGNRIRMAKPTSVRRRRLL